MKVITLGPEGTFSYELCKKQYAHEVIVCRDSIDEVFAAFLEGGYDTALLPLRNNLSGSVIETKNNIERYRLEIVDEFPAKIRYHLVGKRDAKKLLAQPHSYRQCQNTLYRLVGKRDVEYTASNGLTLERFLEKEDVLAVLPVHVVEKYQLEVLEREIQDNPENETLFVLLRKKEEGHNIPLPVQSSLEEN